MYATSRKRILRLRSSCGACSADPVRASDRTHYAQYARIRGCRISEGAPQRMKRAAYYRGGHKRSSSSRPSLRAWRGRPLAASLSPGRRGGGSSALPPQMGMVQMTASARSGSPDFLNSRGGAPGREVREKKKKKLEVTSSLRGPEFVRATGCITAYRV